jgi:hypothetical protein
MWRNGQYGWLMRSYVGPLANGENIKLLKLNGVACENG